MADSIKLNKKLLFEDARSFSFWKPLDVDDDVLKELVRLTNLCPTAFNCCPLRVIFARSVKAKQKLSEAMADVNKDKTLNCSVAAILAYDLKFYNKLNVLFPHVDVKGMFVSDDEMARETAFRNSSMQCAYFIMSARLLGLDCGPMSGFNADMVRDSFFNQQDSVIPNIVCALGRGDRDKLHDRLPRLAFGDVAKVI